MGLGHGPRYNYLGHIFIVTGMPAQLTFKDYNHWSENILIRYPPTQCTEVSNITVSIIPHVGI